MVIQDNGNKPEEKVNPPASSPEANGGNPPKESVETPEADEKDIDFTKKLEELEGKEPIKPKKDEKSQAEYNLRSMAKRAKELGIDTSTILGDGSPPAPEPAPDNLATKDDLAMTEKRIKASKLAKSPAELNLMMWYVKNKDVTVEQAHLLANEGRIKKNADEIARASKVQPATPSGGGQRTPETKTTKMSEANEKRLQASGLVFDPATNAYTGKKTRVRYDGAKWIHERLLNGKWIRIEDASQFE